MDGPGDGGVGRTGSGDHAASRLLVFELQEYRDSVQDSDAARFYFVDLSDANGGGSSAEAGDNVLSYLDVPSSALVLSPTASGTATKTDRNVFLGVGSQRVRMGRDHDLRGLPKEGKEVRHLRVEIAVIRLPSHQTDLLITLSTPTTDELDRNLVPSTNVSEVFRRAVSKFDILDWSLLGSAA
jgi:Ran-interacting Mog1 protein